MAEAQIDFETVQFDGDGVPTLACSQCQTQLTTYHTLNGAPLCESCVTQANAIREGSFFKALLLGGLAAILGAALYYGIVALTGYELGLVAIVVGIMVGVGVRMGAGGRTSMIYRLMALAFAYVSITSAYVPSIVEGLVQPDGEAVAAATDAGGGATVDAAAPVEASNATYILGFILALMAPAFMVAEGEIMGVIILGIGLWEAWRLSAPRDHEVLGPFTTERASAAGAPQSEAVDVLASTASAGGVTPGTGT